MIISIKGLACYLTHSPCLVNVHYNYYCLNSLLKTCTQGNQCVNEESSEGEGSAPVKAEPPLQPSPKWRASWAHSYHEVPVRKLEVLRGWSHLPPDMRVQDGP